MKRVYEEKFVEELIRDHPEEFIGEKLQLYKQQRGIGGFKPDLIFKDEENTYVIVEVQIDALDRNHLYRTLEYRDLLIQKEKCERPKVIVFCNTIPKKYLNILKIHDIPCIAVKKDKLIKKAKILYPELEIVNKSYIDKPTIKKEGISIEKIFGELNRKVDDVTAALDIDALVLWFAPWFPEYLIRTDNYNNLHELKEIILPPSLESIDLFYNLEDDEEHKKKKKIISKDLGLDIDHIIPKEVIIDYSSIENILHDDLRILHDWLYFFPIGPDFPIRNEEIIFGREGGGPYKMDYDDIDIYEYDQYIKGSVKQYRLLQKHYGVYPDDGYIIEAFNIEAIKNDLNRLKQITFYVGKYPNLTPLNFCRNFEIEEGPGELIENLKHYRRSLIDWHKYSEDKLKEFDKYIENDRKNWLTIRFNGVEPGVTSTLNMMIPWNEDIRSRTKIESVEYILNQKSLDSVKHISSINPEAMELTAKYFYHLMGPVST